MFFCFIFNYHSLLFLLLFNTPLHCFVVIYLLISYRLTRFEYTIQNITYQCNRFYRIKFKNFWQKTSQALILKVLYDKNFLRIFLLPRIFCEILIVFSPFPTNLQGFKLNDILKRVHKNRMHPFWLLRNPLSPTRASQKIRGRCPCSAIYMNTATRW